MKQFGRKLISSMLALIMVVSLLPVNVLAVDEDEMINETEMDITAPVVMEEIQSQSVAEEAEVQESVLEADDSAVNSGSEDPYSGECGTYATYELSEEGGVLTISGTGAMADYASADKTPWYSFRNKIITVVVADGIVDIGVNAFASCGAMLSISIPDSVTYIGSNAFSGCDSLTGVYYDGTVAAWNNVSGNSEVGDVKVHCYVIDKPVDATCEENGLTEGKHCSACDEVYVPQTFVPAQGHQWDDGVVTTEPKNTTAGVKTFTCSACSKTKTESFTGTAPELKSVINTVDGVEFAWYAVADEDVAAYRVYRTNGSNRVNLGSTDQTTFVDTTASVGVLYTYTVCCLNDDGKVISVCNANGKSIIRLAQPTITGIEGTASGVQIKWKNAVGAASYHVYLQDANGWTKLGEVTGTSYTYKEVSSNNEYTFAIRSASGSYLSGDENTVTLFYVAAPAVPTVSNDATGVAVRWTAVEGAAGYRVYRKVSGGSWTVIADCETNSYIDTTAESGVKYSYTVACLDGDGNKSSGYNTTGSSITYVAQPAFRSVSSVNGGIKLTWNKVDGAAYYRIYMVTENGLKTLTDVSGTSYTYNDVISGKEYIFAIRCLDSNLASVSTCDEAGTSIVYVDAPVITKIKNADGGIYIEWNPVKGAAQYRVLVKNGANWEAVNGDTEETGFLFTDAVSGESYSLTVRCVDEDGNYISGYDTTGKTIAYYKAPTLRSASNTAEGVQIRWYTVTGAASYRIYRMGGSVTEFKSLADTIETTYVDTTAKSGVEYTYTVACLDAAGKLISAYDTNGVAVLRVSQPEISKIENTASAVKLTWKSVNGAAQYRVYIRLDGSWDTLADVDSTEFLYTEVTSGATYTFTIRALDEEGNELSSYNPVGASIQFVEQPNITSTVTYTYGFKVNWTKSEGVYGYHLLINNDGSWERVTTEPVLTNGYKFTGAVNGETYTFSVRGVDVAGNYVTTYDSIGWTVTFYSTPVLQSAKAETDGILFSWEPVEGARAYTVLRKGGDIKNYQRVAEGLTDSYYKDTNVASGVKYTYSVFCVDEDGNRISGYYDTGLSASYVDSPKNITLVNSSTGVIVKWDRVDGATQYRVMMLVDDVWVPVKETASLTYTHKKPVDREKYVFAVAAYDNAWSGFDENGVEIVYYAAPVPMKAENINGGIKFTWYPVVGIDEYRVYRKGGQNSGFVEVGDVSNNEFVDMLTEDGVKYTYTVAGLDENGVKITGYNITGVSVNRVGEPVIKSLANATTGTVLNWYKVPGATKYRVFCMIDGEWEQLGQTSSTSFVHSDVEHGKQYQYTVSAYNETWGYYNAGDSIVYIEAPKHVGASNVSAGIRFAWEPVDGISEYCIFRKASSETSFVMIADGITGTSYIDPTAKDGVTYTYSVACMDEEGNRVSSYHTSKTVIKRVGEPVISSIKNSSTGVIITWNKVSGATKYRVYMKEDNAWVKVKDTTSTTFTYTGAEHGESYEFTVAAYASSWGSYDQVGKNIVYVDAPVKKSITNVTEGIKFTWKPVAGVSEYIVYRKGGDVKNLEIYATEITGTEFIDTEVESGVKYTYTVACSENGEKISGYNTTGLSIKRVGEPEYDVENKVSGVKISWTKVPGATKYRVYIKDGSEWKVQKETTSTSYIYTAAKTGKTYEFTVRAYAGSWGSYDQVGKSTTYYAAPTMKSVTNIEEGVKVTWKVVTGVSDYVVYRKGGDDTGFTELMHVVGNVFVDDTAESGVKYTYTVASANSDGDVLGAYTTTGAKSITRIAQPEFTSVENSEDGIVFEWDKVPGAYKYRILRKSGSGWVTVTTTTKDTYTYKSAKDGKEYTFTIRCMDKNGNYIGSYDVVGVDITYEK